MVAIVLVADLELFEIRLIVHVPAKDDRAEAETISGDGQELLLRDQLAAQLAVDIDASELDFRIVLEKLWQRFSRDLIRLFAHCRRDGLESGVWGRVGREELTELSG